MIAEKQHRPLALRRVLALRLIKLVQRVRVLGYRLVSFLPIEGRLLRYQPVHAIGEGRLEIEGKVRVGVFPSPHFLSSYAHIEARHPGSIIVIGDGTWISNGFALIAEYSSVRIGRRCLIGANVEITDSDFHGLELCDRHRSNPAWCKPVVIGDDVFIGAGVRILKGVVIGNGAVLASGSIVVRDVPPFSVVGGNPARLIRMLDQNHHP